MPVNVGGNKKTPVSTLIECKVRYCILQTQITSRSRVGDIGLTTFESKCTFLSS
jgi:hypothetical protein